MNEQEKQEFYEKCKVKADKYIGDQMDGLGWNDLSDVNSLWDFIDPEMDEDTLNDAIKEACEERIDLDYNE